MVRVSPDEITEELDIFGLEATNDVLNELIKVCDNNVCSAEEIVTKWVAFSHSSGKYITISRSFPRGEAFFY